VPERILRVVSGPAGSEIPQQFTEFRSHLWIAERLSMASRNLSEGQQGQQRLVRGAFSAPCPHVEMIESLEDRVFD
jgi:hypothetical protein